MKNNSSWDYDSIENTTSLIKDGTHNPPIRLKEGIPLLSAQNIKNGKISFKNITYISKDEYDKIHKHYKIKKGDVLLTIVGTLGNCAIVNIDELFSLQRSVAILRFNEKKILNEFIKQYSQSHDFKKQLFMRSKKAVQTGIYLNDIKTINVPVPPLVEQRGIAEVLGTVDESIGLTDQFIERTEKLKRGLMQRLLTQGIGHTEFKDTQLGKIPKIWNVVELRKLVEYKNGIYKPEEYYGQGPPSIRMNNIINGEILKNGAPLLDVTDEELGDYGLLSGDLVINRVNSIDLVGKVGIVKEGFGSATFESKNIRLRLKTDTMNPEFLNYVLNTMRIQYKIRSYAKSAVSQATITQSDLDKLHIQIPPIYEQLKIVRIINETIDQLKSLNIQKESQVKIKGGLMQVLLSGIVRVELREDGLHRIGNC